MTKRVQETVSMLNGLKGVYLSKTSFLVSEGTTLFSNCKLAVVDRRPVIIDQSNRVVDIMSVKACDVDSLQRATDEVFCDYLTAA